MKRTVFLAGVCAFFCCIYLASCNKYEDGPAFSLLSAEKRLYGTYTLDKYTINGVDSLQEMANRWGTTFTFWHNKDTYHDVIEINGPGISNPCRSTYTLVDKNRSFRVIGGAGILTADIELRIEDIDFELLRLKNNDIHFRTNFNEKEYYFEISSQ